MKLAGRVKAWAWYASHGNKSYQQKYKVRYTLSAWSLKEGFCCNEHAYAYKHKMLVVLPKPLEVTMRLFP